jgi:hypothetical protein
MGEFLEHAPIAASADVVSRRSFHWRAVGPNDVGRNRSLVQEVSARRVRHGPIDDARKGTIP